MRVEAAKNICPRTVTEAQVQGLALKNLKFRKGCGPREVPRVEPHLRRYLFEQMRPDVIRICERDQMIHFGGRTENQFRLEEIVGTLAFPEFTKLAEPICETLGKAHARGELLVFVVLQTSQ